MSSQAVQGVEKKTLKWQRAKSTGNHFVWLPGPGRRVLTVFRKFGKWNYAVQLEDGRDYFKNGFLSEADAMNHAEENFGIQPVEPERSPARATPNLSAVPNKPKAQLDVPPDPNVEVRPEAEDQSTELETLSAKRSHKEYLSAYLGQDQTPWGRVLMQLSGGTKLPLELVATRSSLSVEETIKLLKDYDPEIAQIQFIRSDVQLTWTDKFYNPETE